MKSSILKRYKVLIVGFCVTLVLYYLYEGNFTKLFKQRRGSYPNDSIPVYFYKKQSDLTDPFTTCEYHCRMEDGFSRDENAVIVFQGPQLHNWSPLTKYPGQLWVFFSMEPPTLHPPSSYLKMWKNVFNWTLGYRRDADILHTYGNFSLLPAKKKSSTMSPSWNSRSNKSIIFVSHCGVASKRLQYLKNMNPSYGVDVYGYCGDFYCPKSNWGECHDKIRSYKFYLAFENSLCKDYVTEKMFKIYRSYLRAIPVGRGRTQYELFLPPKSYLDTSKYHSEKELTDHMWCLSQNEPEASDYFKWTNSYVANSDPSYGFCELCKRLHDPVLMKKHTRIYRDIDSWLRGSEHNQMCATPTDLV